MKARILIITGLFFLKIAHAMHPIHVSVVNMDFLSDSNMIKYSICLYYEDFQSLINFKYNTLIDFKHQNRMTYKEQNSILEYLNSSFVLKNSHNKALSSEFLNWKIEEDMICMYFGMKDFSGINELIIENKLMVDLFADQKNLLIINIGNRQEGYEFNKRNASYTVLLKNE